MESNSAATPASEGFSWPAEWEHHAATWLSWPHNRDTWPGCHEGAQDAFVAIVRALHAHEAVCVNVADEAMEERARARLAAGGVAVDDAVRFHRIPTDDAWLRDCGPLFVVREAGGRRKRALVDFRFDAWGRKYEPWDCDDAVPARIAEALGLRRFAADLVLEGGSIDGNGQGAILTTESCLLHPSRGPGRSRETLERVLASFLGARQVLWLGRGVEGDDTDGHVDDLARFIDPQTVVCAVETDPADANFAALTDNRRRLSAMRDQDGKPLAVVDLPMPPRVMAGGRRLPASYANFYLANGVALVPRFGAPSDERALAVLREALPGREVVGIPCRDLVAGFGAIHCVTQQEPA